jgi:hypothetical protein
MRIRILMFPCYGSGYQFLVDADADTDQAFHLIWIRIRIDGSKSRSTTLVRYSLIEVGSGLEKGQLVLMVGYL